MQISRADNCASYSLSGENEFITPLPPPSWAENPRTYNLFVGSGQQWRIFSVKYTVDKTKFSVSIHEIRHSSGVEY